MIRKNGDITCGVTTDFPPFFYIKTLLAAAVQQRISRDNYKFSAG